MNGIEIAAYLSGFEEFCCYRLTGEASEELKIDFLENTIVLNNLDSDCGLCSQDQPNLSARGTAVVLEGTRLRMQPGKYDLFFCMQNLEEGLLISSS